MEHIPRAQPRSCMHAAREYVAWYMLVYEHVCVTLHAQGILLYDQFAGREKGINIVGSAVAEILQPLCVVYCPFVTLLN